MKYFYFVGDFIEYKEKRYLCLEQTCYLPDKDSSKWKEEVVEQFYYINENGTKFIIKPKIIKDF